MRVSLPLFRGQGFRIRAAHLENHAELATLGEERVIVDKSPQCDERVDGSSLAIITKESLEPRHLVILTSVISCFIGSNRRRAREEDSRIRSMSASRPVAHHANA